ncbi:MAG: HNH endonuclease [Lachnospiraceae bacterium]|nr:HNH endonuclease [Lachnospiraceae bacterium]
MPEKKYSEEIKEFVRRNIEGRSNKELAELVNDTFGTEFTESKIKAFNGNYKIHRKSRTGYIRYYGRGFPREVIEFINKNYKGIGPKKMAELLNGKFGSSYTKEQIKGYYANHDLNSGLTGHFKKGSIPYNKGKTWKEYMSEEAQKKSLQTTFRKGEAPSNELPLGTISKRGDGQTLIKVSMTGKSWERWKTIQRKVWEEHHGPIPQGMMISFKDGNNENFDIDNLFLMTKGENAQLNRRKLRFKNAERTETGIIIARIYEKVRERRKAVNDRR